MLLASGAFGFVGLDRNRPVDHAIRPAPLRPEQDHGQRPVGGNLVVIGGMMSMLIGATIVGQFRKGLVTPDHWYVVVLMAALAACFYFASLRQTAALLLSRRERLLAVVEGRA